MMVKILLALSKHKHKIFTFNSIEIAMVDFRLAILKYIDGKLAFGSIGVQRW